MSIPLCSASDISNAAATQSTYAQGLHDVLNPSGMFSSIFLSIPAGVIALVKHDTTIPIDSIPGQTSCDLQSPTLAYFMGAATPGLVIGGLIAWFLFGRGR